MTALLELLRLSPDHLIESVIFLAGFMVVCEYLRISLATAFPRSAVAHAAVNLLTVVLQPVFLAVVLVLSISAHPERALVNLGIVLGLYGVWYLAGQSTLLVRPDSQGADLGFMSVGAVLTFVPGLVAAVAC